MKWIVLFIALAGACCATQNYGAAKRTKKQAKQSRTVVELTSKSQLTKSLGKDKAVVLKFYLPSCPNCQNFEPIFEAFAAKHKDHALFLAGNVETKSMDTLSDEYGVEALPAIIFFDVEGKKVAQKDGMLSSDELDELLESALKTGDDTDENDDAEEPIVEEVEIIELQEIPSASTVTMEKAEKKARELSSRAEYDELIKNNTVVAKLSASWCGPCQMMEAPFAAVGEQFKDSAVFVEIDIDNPEFQELARTYAYEGIPALIFIKDGDVIDQSMGGKSEHSITQFVQDNMNGKAARKEAVAKQKTTLSRGKPAKK